MFERGTQGVTAFPQKLERCFRLAKAAVKFRLDEIESERNTVLSELATQAQELQAGLTSGQTSDLFYVIS
jgi:hypothetical protein